MLVGSLSFVGRGHAMDPTSRPVNSGSSAGSSVLPCRAATPRESTARTMTKTTTMATTEGDTT